MRSEDLPQSSTPSSDDETAVLSSPYGDAAGSRQTTPSGASGDRVARTSIIPTSGATAASAPEAAETTVVPAVAPATGASETTTLAAATPAEAPDAEAGSTDDGSWDDEAEEAPRRRRRWPWIAAAALVLVGVVGGGSYAYSDHYTDAATPGTTVAGSDVSGMTHDEIVKLVEDKAAKSEVSITGDATATASLADLGTTVDAEKTADAAMADSQSVTGRFKALVDHTNVDVVTKTDVATAQKYAQSLVPADKTAAKDASVVLSDDGTTFVTTKAVNGTSLDSSAMEEAAQAAAQGLTTKSISVTYSTTTPAVTDEDAQKVADAANALVAQDVTVSNEDGSKTFTPDAATKATWVTVTAQDGKAPALGADGSKIGEWVATQGATLNVDAVTGVRNVNSKGDVVETVTEAVDGTKVSNMDEIATALTEAFPKGEGWTGTFKTETTKAQWKERKIADGAENLAYQASDGEKWVDINLTNKTVTAYEGSKVVHGPVSVVDGAAATPTVTGTFHVYLKYESQTMQGQNADGSDYKTEGVPWISYFYEGYALHGAPWRSSFGYSGSHGCLNMPVSDAKWFYDWDEVGTTVVSHT
ncbi:L,D-transpeptidase family protein [Actinomyces haliotis]|uniref:L,D-transpeptidase family protein n=1 Tax=Actinomyces haliotis TaxID=1280843 RepID=UPI00189044E9|nr:L,D-transpeptidase family protein [Actinomyces haliotis]